MMRPRFNFPAALWIPTALVIGFLLCATWCMEAPAIPYRQMEKMRVGMTSAEVLKLLGPPKSKYAEAFGSEGWVYSRHTWAMFNVFVGADGTDVNYDYDF